MFTKELGLQNVIHWEVQNISKNQELSVELISTNSKYKQGGIRSQMACCGMLAEKTENLTRGLIMKKFFDAIRKSDLNTVKELIEKKPELILSIARQPKKDNGQSPLQVAIKSNNLEIANYLLDKGADVNFMEAEDCLNDWRMPVLHDAIRCAVMHSRFNKYDIRNELQVFHTKEEADNSYNILKRLLENGADISKKDSKGNSVLERVVLDARQVLPAFHRATNELAKNREITEEIKSDLSRIFKLLFEYGVDPNGLDRISNMRLIDYYNGEPVCEFLK